MNHDTSVTPGRSIDVSGCSPKKDGTSDGTVYAGFLTELSVSTYGNGVTYMSANWGDSNTVEAEACSVEIDPIHPTSGNPYDLTTVYAAGLHVNLVVHQVGLTYWLKGSSITTVKNSSKLIPAGAGLIKAAVAHTATPLPIHMWKAVMTVTSGTWVKGTYLGMISGFTA